MKISLPDNFAILITVYLYRLMSDSEVRALVPACPVEQVRPLRLLQKSLYGPFPNYMHLKMFPPLKSVLSGPFIFFTALPPLCIPKPEVSNIFSKGL